MSQDAAPPAHDSDLIASYDAVPYVGEPFRQTHPDWISATARLLSIPVVPPQKCRVLELGCCDGGNLIPMAADLPEATFIGVDHSPVQIDMGRRIVQRLGLKNIDLRTLSIADITPEWGQFDYIIAHGVFSWAPYPIQEKILELCNQLLSPDGVAYISYNTYPGWHLKGIVRDMMRYYAMRFEQPQRRLAEARRILEFVAQNATGKNAQEYATVLRAEAEFVRNSADFYLYHDHLEENCDAFYFHQFIERARGHGLDYLGESRVGTMAPAALGPAVAKSLSEFPTNVIEVEQFQDFLRNRTFRETLLHRMGRTPVYKIEPSQFAGLYVSSAARLQSKTVDLRPETLATFESPSKLPVNTKTPLLKAALLRLMNAFPAPTLFETLVDEARADVSKANVSIGERSIEMQGLGSALIALMTTTDMIEITSLPGGFTTNPGHMPVASPVARLYAQTQTAIPTRRHDTVRLSEKDCAILKLLDGTHTLRETAALAGETENATREIFRRLARCALLIA